MAKTGADLLVDKVLASPTAPIGGENVVGNVAAPHDGAPGKRKSSIGTLEPQK